LFKLRLLPRENKFFILFQQEAENVVKMARQLRELVHVWENVKERVSILNDLERDGDAITHEIMSLLYRTFITPFDREDINALAQSLDDIADHIHCGADIMFLYKVERPNDRAKELADVVLQAAVEVEKAMSEIGGRIDQKQIYKRCVEIHRVENLGDNAYRSALADLFAEPGDMSRIVKWREIYGEMESAIDSSEIVANVLEGIALKS